MRAHFVSILSLGGLLAIGACSAAGKSTQGEDTTQGGPGSGGSGVGHGGSGATSTGKGGGTASTGSHAGGGTATGTGTGTGSGGAGGCAPFSGDCNKDPADGCETSLANDAKNCGACGNVCPAGGGVAGACVAGKCTLDCAKGAGNCDGNAANGCEADLAGDAKNCGGCGVDCGGQPCVQGACACAAETQTAELVQLDLLVMLDQSASMQDAVQGGGSKWDAVTTALQGFLSDPNNASLGVGLQYFGLPPSKPAPVTCNTDADCGAYGPCFLSMCMGAAGGGDSCDPSDYSKAAIEIAPLAAAQVSALESSIKGHNANGASTPTAPAIQGAVAHSQAWEQTHPDHGVVVILATDGDPTGCGNQDPVGAAAAGLAGSPSIKTFVIGVGSSLQSLNGIAAAGGTSKAFIVDTNQANVIQQFEAALQQIQKAALGCEYSIPQPKQGQLDYAKVNVEYTPGNGQPPEMIKNVASKAACDPKTGGWYYDNAAKPTKILLCDATCGPVEGDAKAKVEVLLGCATQHQ
jgi:hypothetical protein